MLQHVWIHPTLRVHKAQPCGRWRGLQYCKTLPKSLNVYLRTVVALRSKEWLVTDAVCISLSHKARQQITALARDGKEQLLLSIIITCCSQRHGLDYVQRKTVIWTCSHLLLFLLSVSEKDLLYFQPAVADLMDSYCIAVSYIWMEELSALQSQDSWGKIIRELLNQCLPDTYITLLECFDAAYGW